jgi:hypothetical protein
MSAVGMAVATGITAATTIGGQMITSSNSSKANKKAAEAQRAAIMQALKVAGESNDMNQADLQKMYEAVSGIWDKTTGEIKQQQTPYQTLGNAATAGISDLMGVPNVTRTEPVSPERWKPENRQMGGSYKGQIIPKNIAYDDYVKSYDTWEKASLAAAGPQGPIDSWRDTAPELSRMISDRAAGFTKERQSADKIQSAKSEKDYALAVKKYQADKIAYQKAVDQDKKSPTYGSATKTYEQVSGKKMPEFKPYQDYKPTEFKPYKDYKPYAEAIPKFTPTTIATMKADPGYQARLNEGMKSLQNSQAAQGGLLSGNAIRGGIEYGQDYASNEFGKADQRNNQNWQNNMAGWNTGYDKYNQDYATGYSKYMGDFGTQNQINKENYGIGYSKNMSDFSSQLQNFAGQKSNYEANRDLPFNRFMQMMGIGQAANQVSNQASTTGAQQQAGAMTDFTSGKITSRNNFTDQTMSGLTGIGQSTANEAIQGANIKNQAIGGYVDSINSLAGLFGNSMGGGSSTSNAAANTGTSGTGGFSSWAKNLFAG